ncbi:Endonuclease/exonuclease/phosphatase, partial [Cubamyces lactineus]
MLNSLHVVYHNVNHSPQHTHYILEQCAAMNVDVVCLQEPWYGPLRPIPSASPTGPAERTRDNMLYGTQLHPAWTLVENCKDARVVCHVNRRLANAVISVDSTVKHRDCMLLLVRLRPEHDPTVILNLYNDVNNAAVRYLADISETLPPIDVMGGDYNTHAQLWDPTYPADSQARVGEVLDLHATLGMRLLSPPGVQTHFPHREGLRSTVIDLVWVPNDRDEALYRISVKPEERGLSDHAVIHVRIPTGEWSFQGAPTIAPESEAEASFIAAISASVLASFPELPHLNTAEELQEATDRLFNCITDAWNRNASPRTICNKSRLWWDGSCSEARDNLLRARARLAVARAQRPDLVQAARAAVHTAYNQLKSAIRKRRRQHMDERIRYVAEQQR